MITSLEGCRELLPQLQLPGPALVTAMLGPADGRGTDQKAYPTGDHQVVLLDSQRLTLMSGSRGFRRGSSHRWRSNSVVGNEGSSASCPPRVALGAPQ